jgi:hypothetical protein
VALDLDALVTGPCHAAFGETVTYYPGGGPMLTLTCPFTDKFVQPSFSDGEDVVDYRTVVNVRAALLIALGHSATPVKGELFRARGVLYVINVVDPPDDGGDIRIYLGLASDTEAKRIPLPPL